MIIFYGTHPHKEVSAIDFPFLYKDGPRAVMGVKCYTQYPIIRNSLVRNSDEFLGKFKKQALGRSNLRNASKKLRNAQCSDFQS